MKDILGGKGAGLCEMTQIGLPVPPGFTITTEVCAEFYANNKKYPAGLEAQVEEQVKALEKIMGKYLGDPKDPLLVSVRSGAAVSMPGMMDTILNLGLNDASVKGLTEKSKNQRFALDSYRRFIQMFSETAMNIEHNLFEHVLTEIKKKRNIKLDFELSEEELAEVIAKFKAIYKEKIGRTFLKIHENNCGHPLEQSLDLGIMTEQLFTADLTASSD